MLESGDFYNLVIDPLLAKARARVARQVPQGRTVIDIACGTGAQAFAMALSAQRVVGIDLSESMIKKARQLQQRKGVTNVCFKTGNAADLLDFHDKQFDLATMTFVLHQLDPQIHSSVLNEMRRVAKRLVFFDYSIPLPLNPAGLVCRAAERLAGGMHYQNFRYYSDSGGLPEILEKNSLNVEKQLFFSSRAFELVVCPA